MRDKSEKQTIRQYLFNLKTPPLYSLIPGENRDRLNKVYDYGDIQGQILHQKNKEDAREWRFEDIVPRNEEDRKRLQCVYRHAWNEAKRDVWKNQNSSDPFIPFSKMFGV